MVAIAADELCPVPESYTKPYINFDGKNPMKLYDIKANDIALDFNSSSTILSIIPVMHGSTELPNNKVNQVRTTDPQKLSIYGIQKLLIYGI